LGLHESRDKDGEEQERPLQKKGTAAMTMESREDRMSRVNGAELSAFTELLWSCWKNKEKRQMLREVESLQ
jgi:hypothetical protein